MYLGRPLCSKHWQKISEMPLDKARERLKLPHSTKSESLPAARPPEAGASPPPGPRLEPETATASDPIRQMNIFGQESTDPDSYYNRERKPRRRKPVKKKAATGSGDTPAVIQRDLFGDGMEEAS
jgi:hypothetical protein